MLEERINEDIKSAMKAGDKVRLETLRSIRSGIIYHKTSTSGAGREMNEHDEIKILNAAAKQRKDAIQQYTEHNRPDSAAKEQAELDVIMEYLPKQMSEDEVRAAVKEIIDSVGASGPGDFGKVMGASMKQLKGKADGSLIQGLVKELLNG